VGGGERRRERGESERESERERGVSGVSDRERGVREGVAA